MREPISRDSASTRELVEATKRLDRALQLLEAAWAAKGSSATGAPDERALAALESDRARLAAELEVARVREDALASAAAAASKALGRAAVEVRAALGEGEDASTSDSGTSDGEQSSGDGLNEEAA